MAAPILPMTADSVLEAAQPIVSLAEAAQLHVVRAGGHFFVR